VSIYARLIAIAAVALALAAGAWRCYTAGQNNIRSAWTAEKLVASENARLKEKALNIATERVDREYQIEKTRLIADKRILNDRLREFASASGRADTSTTSGTSACWGLSNCTCAATTASGIIWRNISRTAAVISLPTYSNSSSSTMASATT